MCSVELDADRVSDVERGRQMRLCRMRDSSERVCERGRGGGNAKVGGSAGGDSHGRSGPRPSHICTVTPKHFIERGDQLLGLCFYMPSRTRKKRTEKSVISDQGRSIE